MQAHAIIGAAVRLKRGKTPSRADDTTGFKLKEFLNQKKLFLKQKTKLLAQVA